MTKRSNSDQQRHSAALTARLIREVALVADSSGNEAIESSFYAVPASMRAGASSMQSGMLIRRYQSHGFAKGGRLVRDYL
jgi:hypothetical protein